MQDLAAAGNDDQGVKTLKKDLLASMKKRMSFEKTELYSVATVLHPKYKRTMFQDRANAEAAVTALRRLVGEEMARSGSVDRATLARTSSSSSASSSNDASVSESFQDKMRRRRHEAEAEMTDVVFEDASTLAVVDSYVKSPIEDMECLAFWKKKEVEAAGSPAKEALVRVAKKFLTPLATSVDVERLFSECGAALTKKRNSLCPDRLDKIIFIRKNIVIIGFDIDWE
jgi:hypothetical protein